MKKAILLLHHPSLDFKGQQGEKNMFWMLLSLSTRATMGRTAPFCLPAYTRAIYHLEWPFLHAKCITISLSSVLCPRATSDGNIAVPDEYQHRLGRPGAFYEQLERLSDSGLSEEKNPEQSPGEA